MRHLAVDVKCPFPSTVENVILVDLAYESIGHTSITCVFMANDLSRNDHQGSYEDSNGHDVVRGRLLRNEKHSW